MGHLLLAGFVILFFFVLFSGGGVSVTLVYGILTVCTRLPNVCRGGAIGVFLVINFNVRVENVLHISSNVFLRVLSWEMFLPIHANELCVFLVAQQTRRGHR